jgi:HEAT repeat protein
VAAARSVGAARQPGGVEVLARLASDLDVSVRLAAYEALGLLGDRALAPLQAAFAARAGDPVEAEAIVAALGETRDAGALALLVPLLSGPLAQEAARSIGALGAPAGVAPLVAALQGDATTARLEAVEALGALGSTDAGEAVSRELLGDRPSVRAASARALGRLRYEGAAGRLEALRSDYYAEVRHAALDALARLPGRSPPSRKP